MSCPRKMAVDHRLKPEPSGKQSQAGARAAPGDLYFDSLIQRRQSENSRRQAFASFAFVHFGLLRGFSSNLRRLFGCLGHPAKSKKGKPSGFPFLIWLVLPAASAAMTAAIAGRSFRRGHRAFAVAVSLFVAGAAVVDAVVQMATLYGAAFHLTKRIGRRLGGAIRAAAVAAAAVMAMGHGGQGQKAAKSQAGQSGGNKFFQHIQSPPFHLAAGAGGKVISGVAPSGLFPGGGNRLPPLCGGRPC